MMRRRARLGIVAVHGAAAAVVDDAAIGRRVCRRGVRVIVADELDADPQPP
jgi:hypothetical protein